MSLTEGQILQNGLNLPDGNISANSNQISFVSLLPNGIWWAGSLETFSGQMCSPGDTSSPCQLNETAIASASENSSNILTLNLTLTGANNMTLTLTGPVTGNTFTLQGTVQGKIVTYYGYYETVNNVPSIYLADATNPASPNHVGTLTLPH